LEYPCRAKKGNLITARTLNDDHVHTKVTDEYQTGNQRHRRGNCAEGFRKKQARQDQIRKQPNG
jgi:hypothetical protein